MHEISCPNPARPWTVPVLRHALYIGPWYVLGVLYPLFLMLCFLCLILAEGVAFVFRIWLCFAYRRDAQTTTSKGDRLALVAQYFRYKCLAV